MANIASDVREAYDKLQVPQTLTGKTYDEAVVGAVTEMSHGMVRAQRLGIETQENSGRYALHVGQRYVGELLIEGGASPERLYSGVKGVLKNHQDRPVAMITPIPESRKR